jgi:hypothetical protein
MSSGRALPLSPSEQSQFLKEAIPGRICMIRDHFDDRSYSAMAVVALTSRAFAEFLGIKRGKDGQLVRSKSYFEHSPGLSYEVKISDLTGGKLIDPKKLPANIQKVLSDGIREANLGSAHLTFWRSPVDQTASAGATKNYLDEQYERVRSFGDAVLTLWESAAKTISV